jgi:hypothetical protein
MEYYIVCKSGELADFTSGKGFGVDDLDIVMCLQMSE